MSADILNELTSYQLACLLTEATDVKWTMPMTTHRAAEANCSAHEGHLTVAVEDDRNGGKKILWRFGLSIPHPEGRINPHSDDPYIYITAGGTAENIQAAAEAALSYKPESRDMGGRTWWRDAPIYGGAPDGWVTPILGHEVALTPERDGTWSYVRPVPEFKPVADMIAAGGFGTASARLSGSASCLEEAAALALTAPERLRVAMRAYLAHGEETDDHYSAGVRDGRAALFAEIAAIYRRPSSEQN